VGGFPTRIVTLAVEIDQGDVWCIRLESVPVGVRIEYACRGLGELDLIEVEDDSSLLA
jgi:hypothetical protein